MRQNNKIYEKEKELASSRPPSVGFQGGADEHGIFTMTATRLSGPFPPLQLLSSQPVAISSSPAKRLFLFIRLQSKQRQTVKCHALRTRYRHPLPLPFSGLCHSKRRRQGGKTDMYAWRAQAVRETGPG